MHSFPLSTGQDTSGSLGSTGIRKPMSWVLAVAALCLAAGGCSTSSNVSRALKSNAQPSMAFHDVTTDAGWTVRPVDDHP
jgi:hypothetical protein